jgi:hypothetical protein
MARFDGQVDDMRPGMIGDLRNASHEPYTARSLCFSGQKVRIVSPDFATFDAFVNLAEGGDRAAGTALAADFVRASAGEKCQRRVTLSVDSFQKSCDRPSLALPLWRYEPVA